MLILADFHPCVVQHWFWHPGHLDTSHKGCVRCSLFQKYCLCHLGKFISLDFILTLQIQNTLNVVWILCMSILCYIHN